MKVGVIPKQAQSLLENRLFEFDGEYDALAAYGPDRIGFHRLRARLREAGHEAVTIDQAPLREFDAVVFVDMDFRRLDALLSLKETPPLVYLMREPPAVAPFNALDRFERYAPVFDRVLTWNDTLAARGDRYVQYRIPQYQEREWGDEMPGKDADLLVNVSSRKYSRHPDELYSERERVVAWFDRTHPEEFTLYGRYWNDPPRLADLVYLQFFPETYRTYEGVADSKMDVYRDHRFALCFENMTNIEGYVTEKIFDAFRAGIVPVYWGATNVTDIVPADTFIDYRDVGDPESLREHLVGIDDAEYRKYRERIGEYLEGNFERVSPERFASRVAGVVTDLPGEREASTPTAIGEDIARRATLQRLPDRTDRSRLGRLGTALRVGVRDPSLLSDHYVSLYNALR